MVGREIIIVIARDDFCHFEFSGELRAANCTLRAARLWLEIALQVL